MLFKNPRFNRDLVDFLSMAMSVNIKNGRISIDINQILIYYSI